MKVDVQALTDKELVELADAVNAEAARRVRPEAATCEMCDNK